MPSSRKRVSGSRQGPDALLVSAVGEGARFGRCVAACPIYSTRKPKRGACVCVCVGCWVIKTTAHSPPPPDKKAVFFVQYFPYEHACLSHKNEETGTTKIALAPLQRAHTRVPRGEGKKTVLLFLFSPFRGGASRRRFRCEGTFFFVRNPGFDWIVPTPFAMK